MTQKPHWYRKKVRHDQLVALQKDQRISAIKNNMTNDTISNETKPAVIHPNSTWHDGIWYSPSKYCCKKAREGNWVHSEIIDDFEYHVCSNHFDLELLRNHKIVWRKTSCN